MVKSKGWDWQSADQSIWLDPAEESYYFCEKWKRQGFRSVLDLGCGLGRHSILFARYGFKVTAVDISEYAVQRVREAESKEGLIITSKACDMVNLTPSSHILQFLIPIQRVFHRSFQKSRIF